MTPLEALCRFPGLDGLDAASRALLAARAMVVRLPAGASVFGPGHIAEHYLLLLTGSARIQQLNEAGKVIVLYRVSPGESCVLTTACLIGHDAYPAEGVAETDVTALAVPAALFDELMARSAPFRAFVFSGFSRRIAELFRVIDEVAFGRMDLRLAQRLLALAGEADSLAITQQALAVELGTAREVVSRLLGGFQRRGWISLGRGMVMIADRPALERFAATEAVA